MEQCSWFPTDIAKILHLRHGSEEEITSFAFEPIEDPYDRAGHTAGTLT